jgi:myo-inositol-1-phosphate synthase
MNAATGRTGVWLIGARGSVATTAVVGAAAIRSGLAEPSGLVTGQTPFSDLGLPAVSDLVFGGHDIAATSSPKRAQQLADAGVIPPHVLRAVNDDLVAVDSEIRPGVVHDGEQRAAAAAVADDIASFRNRHSLARVVVVNVASTEPPVELRPEHSTLAALESALDGGRPVLPPSSLYAYAAFRAGCPFVEFTPSAGPCLPALDQLAREQAVPYAGRDGKTGETLVKSALGPMFASRSLRVHSWAGTNLLGGGDGATLADPVTVQSKTVSKQRAVAEILGYDVAGPLHIDYVADLGEWKTAWDHVSFEGFLGVRMTLQFTWQGCDSALAAPLVIDLARLAARAHQAGVAGAVGALGFFFKDPIAATDHRLAAQYDELCRWAESLGAAG